MNIYPRSTLSSSTLFALALSILVARTPGWWAQVDSNHRPRAYQARALTTWAMSPCKFRCISFSRTVPLSLPLVHTALILGCYVRILFVECGCRHCRPGGDDGNRTHDPLLAGQVLSQLSYTPILGLFTWVNSHSKLNNNERSTQLALCSLAVFFGLVYTNTKDQWLSHYLSCSP